jgi:hypothetical protein
MSYNIVNGQVFVDPPTTPPPSFMETYFPWLSSSYTSSNPEDVDEAILNSVTGPPAPESSHGSNSNSGYPSSSYGSNSGYPSSPSSYQASSALYQPLSSSSYQPSSQFNQNQSPYLTEEDNYLPSASINMPQVVTKPEEGYNPQSQSGYSSNYIPQNNNYQPQPQPQLPPLPYPFNPLPGQITTERPFYAPILDLFGYGTPSIEQQLSLPFPGQLVPSSGYPSQLPNMNSFQMPSASQYAQARHAGEDNERHVDQYYDEGKYAVENEAKSDTLMDVMDLKEESDENNPCPKLGYWHWNGEVCIAVGPVPIWACKPNDLVMTGRVGVCRNKIFFSPGSNPFGNKK